MRGRAGHTQIVYRSDQVAAQIEAVAAEVEGEMAHALDAAVAAAASVSAFVVGVELAAVVGDADVEVVPW